MGAAISCKKDSQMPGVIDIVGIYMYLYMILCTGGTVVETICGTFAIGSTLMLHTLNVEYGYR